MSTAGRLRAVDGKATIAALKALYRLSPHPGVVSHAPDANIRTAFHGTWWYALWGLLRSGRVLESNDASKGHKFWHPGAGRERAKSARSHSEREGE